MTDNLGGLISKIVDDVPPVQERIALFHDVLTEAKQPAYEEAEGETEGINSNLQNALMSDWDTDKVANGETFLRGFLKSFRETQDEEWNQLLATCTGNQQEMLEEFANGKNIDQIYQKFDFGSTRGTREELQILEDSPEAHDLIWLPPVYTATSATTKKTNEPGLSYLTKTPDYQIGLFSDPGKKKKIDIRANVEFSNWGQNFKNTPDYTCVVKTVYGMQEVVKYAKSKNMSVRVSGYRHSWSPTFARDNKSILISTLDLKTATEIPNMLSLQAVSSWLSSTPETELNKIQLIKSFENEKKEKKAWVRVGCATTNESMRSWCIENKQWTLPLNVIMVEITFGGSNAPICHGAGIRHKTLSDLVREIEYVDVNGQLRSIGPQDKEFLLAASGCFGLIGIVTHITLELDSMSYAVMTPAKLDVVDAIPPPPKMLETSLRSKLPKAIQDQLNARTKDQLKKSQEEFERRAMNDYYAEWFWFPYSDQVWINTWGNTTNSSGVQNYPSKVQIARQWLEAVGMEAAQRVGGVSALENVLPMMRTTIVSKMGMASLPHGKTIKTYLPDALHFRRAIQNTQVRDLELEIPLPPRADDKTKPDFTVVQQAWWDAILKVYEYSNTCPMRMPLEMRIMGGSDALMAPQYGNNLGTCSIEILTLRSCSDKWPSFAQDVLDKWMTLRNFNGHELNIRPHWAKEWYDYKVDGEDFKVYLKNKAYKNEIPRFNAILEQIGKKHDWTRADIKKRFSNQMLDELFFADIP